MYAIRSYYGRGVRATGGRTNALRLAGAVILGGMLGPVLMLVGLRQSQAGSVALLLNLEIRNNFV